MIMIMKSFTRIEFIKYDITLEKLAKGLTVNKTSGVHLLVTLDNIHPA